jgi:outer membrane immunogenic protein
LAAFEISGKSARDMKPFITLTFCAMLFGGLALAQEPVAVQRSTERSPESVSFALLTGESFSWTGLYIGGNLGGALNHYEFNNRDVFFDPGQQFNENFGTAFAIEGTGVFDFFVGQQERTDGTVIGGGQIGGQFQFGHFVVGVEGDFDRMAAHESRQFAETQTGFIGGAFDSNTVAQTTLNDFREASSDWMASVRGKVGWAHGPLLFYATGGVAFSDVEVSGNETARTDFFQRTAPGGTFPANFIPLASTTSRNFNQRMDDTLVGWTAGAGVDLALTDVLTVALEYRHSDFGDETFNFNDHGGPFFTNFNSSNNHGGSNVELYSDQVTVRVNLNLCRFFFGSH